MEHDSEYMFSVPIAKDHPACEGHFEGNPLLPGVITLEYVRKALKQFQPQRQIKSFSKVKFTHSLKPGEVLAIHLALEDGGLVKFQCLDSQFHQIAIGNLVIE